MSSTHKDLALNHSRYCRSRFGWGAVCGVQAVEHGRHRFQQGVVVRLQQTGAAHDRCKSRTFRNRNATDIQMMNERSQAREPGVVVQSEAGEQHLKSNLGPDMTELRAVEVKPEGAFRAVLDTL